ncbi:MAG: 30S ribosomal protein S13 [Nanoarchaeota archaeon]
MENIKGIIRVANSDIVGTKPIYDGLRKIKGVNFMFSNAICNYLNLDKFRKIGTLNEKEIKSIEELIKNPADLPKWLLNRRKDYDTGKDLHLTGATLNLSKEFDIKRLKKIKSYRGIRHALGQPVRGQRTRSHFRTGISVGVQRKAAVAAQKSAEKEGKKKREKE